mmetsp:Transcript_54297/g.62442  ORF Transcript_54297/g.62442 Transcript_54297/m.62442 type:complete len:81 (+) Transcript_54297:551-793(+)
MELEDQKPLNQLQKRKTHRIAEGREQAQGLDPHQELGIDRQMDELQLPQKEAETEAVVEVEEFLELEREKPRRGLISLQK